LNFVLKKSMKISLIYKKKIFVLYKT